MCTTWVSDSNMISKRGNFRRMGGKIGRFDRKLLFGTVRWEEPKSILVLTNISSEWAESHAFVIICRAWSPLIYKYLLAENSSKNQQILTLHLAESIIACPVDSHRHISSYHHAMMVSQLLLLVLTLPLVAPFSTIYPTRALLPPKTRTTLCDVRNDNAGKFGLAQSTYDGEVSPWIYSYADLTPETDQTIVGALFLATNVPFLIVGSFFSAKAVLESGLSGLEGELATFSGLTDLAGIVSIWYHWSQLHFGPNRKEVSAHFF